MPADDEPKPGLRTEALTKAEVARQAAEDRERESRERELADLRKQREEAEAQERKTTDQTITDLRAQLTAEQKWTRKLVWWILGTSVGGVLMLLTFIGVLVGVVRTGKIGIPGTGISMDVGQASEQPADEPDPGLDPEPE